jgi:uncharacterized protein YbjQ (UPF0145 family)
MEHLFELGIFVILLMLGLFAGGYAERRHLRHLAGREATNEGFLLSQLRSFPNAVVGGAPPMLVTAEAVIASDYLKSFLSGMRKIFGGEMLSYHSLAVRARREVMQRLIEQARERGYNALCNVRFESADVGGNSKRRNRMPMVAVLGSATAYHCSMQPS